MDDAIMAPYICNAFSSIAIQMDLNTQQFDRKMWLQWILLYVLILLSMCIFEAVDVDVYSNVCMHVCKIVDKMIWWWWYNDNGGSVNWYRSNIVQTW